jgi:hypothetical protein
MVISLALDALPTNVSKWSGHHLRIQTHGGCLDAKPRDANSVLHEQFWSELLVERPVSGAHTRNMISCMEFPFCSGLASADKICIYGAVQCEVGDK